MTRRWTLVMDVSNASAACSLRNRSGLMVCSASGGLWLRGGDSDEALDRELRKLPATARYNVDDEDRLIPLGGLVPVGELPAGPWERIGEWSGPKVQTAALPGELHVTVPLRLVRGVSADDPGLLLTSVEAWCAYAETAPLVRLDRLTFAMADDGRVVVRGSPLPPVAGERYVDTEGIAVPCGFVMQPGLRAADVRGLLDLGPGEAALFAADGTYELIPAGTFVRASRSAARLSRRKHQDA